MNGDNIPFVTGFYAYHIGLELDDSPYRRGSEWRSWRKGWREALRDYLSVLRFWGVTDEQVSAKGRDLDSARSQPID